MKKSIIYCFVLVFMLISCNNSNKEATPDNSAKNISQTTAYIENTQVESTPQTDVQTLFGFTNNAGSKLIVLPENNINPKSMTNFKYAIGENGKIYKIEYSHYKIWSDEENPRNIEEDSCVYKFLNNQTAADKFYLLLTQEEYEQTTVYQKTANSSLATASEKLIEQCSKMAGRKIKNGWTLCEYQNGIKISLVEFEKNENDLLAWVVLEDSKSIRYCPYPAELSEDGEHGWSGYDKGDLNMTDYFGDKKFIFSVLCVIRNQNGKSVYLERASYEFQLIKLFDFPNAKTVSDHYFMGGYDF